MKITDYSGIASRYDNNQLRHEIAIDENIAKTLSRSSVRVSVLDLACGTANYLVRQTAAYPKADISWFGIDKSPEMLQVAKQKNLNVTFSEGDACNIPMRDETMDYIKVRFAFHHFTDKQKAILEMKRILKPEGMISLFNICHDYMRMSWVYKYYPQVEAFDRERFPSAKEMFEGFETAGFHTEIKISTSIRNYPYEDIIRETENRDMSQLNLIPDEEYHEGLERMKFDAKKRSHIMGDIAFIDLCANKID